MAAKPKASTTSPPAEPLLFEFKATVQPDGMLADIHNNLITTKGSLIKPRTQRLRNGFGQLRSMACRSPAASMSQSVFERAMSPW